MANQWLIRNNVMGSFLFSLAMSLALTYLIIGVALDAVLFAAPGVYLSKLLPTKFAIRRTAWGAIGLPHPTTPCYNKGFVLFGPRLPCSSASKS